MFQSKFAKSSKLKFTSEDERRHIIFDQDMKIWLNSFKIPFLIAGGFYRDLLLGYYPSDIDIYISKKDWSRYDLCRKSIINKLNLSEHEWEHFDDYPPGRTHIHSHLKGYLNYPLGRELNMIKVDVLLINTENFLYDFDEYPAHCFDVEMSKIWYDSRSHSMRMSTLVPEDIEKGTISCNSFVRNSYMEKLQEYFPICRINLLPENNTMWEYMTDAQD